jgi:signal peptidase I
MFSIIVDIALATLCITSSPTLENDIPEPVCYPVLVGKDTPKGEYQVQQRLIETKGYGGDILQFKDDDVYVYAIHRVWLGRPWEKRDTRLKNPDPKFRRITMGCINVDPKVYEELINCCSMSKLTIK